MTFSKTMVKTPKVQSSLATNTVLIPDPPCSHKSMLTEKRTATQSRRQWGWVLKTSTAWWRRGLAAWWCEGHTWPRWGIQSLWLPPPAMLAVQTSCKTSCGRWKIVLVCLPQPLLTLVPWQMWSTCITNNNSRVIHKVVDFPHGDASNVHEEDETEKHQVVFWRHPQHKLQVEGIELCQKELQRKEINAFCVWEFF